MSSLQRRARVTARLQSSSRSFCRLSRPLSSLSLASVGRKRFSPHPGAARFPEPPSERGRSTSCCSLCRRRSLGVWPAAPFLRSCGDSGGTVQQPWRATRTYWDFRRLAREPVAAANREFQLLRLPRERGGSGR